VSSCLIQLELKYCERCGGLWLRPTSASAIYCSPCALAMSEMAQPKQTPFVALSERPRRQSKGRVVESRVQRPSVVSSARPLTGPSDRQIPSDPQITGGAA